MSITPPHHALCVNTDDMWASASVLAYARTYYKVALALASLLVTSSKKLLQILLEDAWVFEDTCQVGNP